MWDITSSNEEKSPNRKKVWGESPTWRIAAVLGEDPVEGKAAIMAVKKSWSSETAEPKSAPIPFKVCDRKLRRKEQKSGDGKERRS